MAREIPSEKWKQRLESRARFLRYIKVAEPSPINLIRRKEAEIRWQKMLKEDHGAGTREGGVVAEAPEPNSLEDFEKRYEALAKEAIQYGIVTVAVLMDPNPFNNDAKRTVIYEGNFYTAWGAAEAGREYFRNQESSPQ